MVAPTPWGPGAALTMPAATAAAEPLEDPPGVCAVFQGLRVPRGSDAANSVVTVLPTITAPASRSARTLAASFSERQPANSGEPISVGISAVSIMSLMPTGIPSIGDNGLPARQRSVESSAAARAAGRLVWTKAPIRGSHSSKRPSERSRNWRGVSLPEAKFCAAATYGRITGFSCSCVAMPDLFAQPSIGGLFLRNSGGLHDLFPTCRFVTDELRIGGARLRGHIGALGGKVLAQFGALQGLGHGRVQRRYHRRRRASRSMQPDPALNSRFRIAKFGNRGHVRQH